MATTSQILAKLGIDSSGVPAELAEADKFFKKFAREAEQTTGTKAGGASGGKFMKAFQAKFSGAGLFGMLSTALGLNIDKIADKVAEAFQQKFGGGTAKAFAEAEKLADEVAKRQAEANDERLSGAQKIERAEREIAKAIAKQNELSKTGNNLTADQMIELNRAQLAQLEAEKRLSELRKTDRQTAEEYAKKQAEYDRSKLSKQEQIASLEKEIFKTAVEMSATNQTAGERDKKRIEILEKQKEIDQITKDLADERLKAEEKVTKEKERQADLSEKIAKGERQIAEKRAELKEREGALKDRSRLTVAELAKLPGTERAIEVEAARSERRRREAFTFGADADLNEEQRTAKENARKVLDLEAEGEAARVRGDQAKAEEIFSQVGQLRESLVASGAVKSTEGDPQKELLKEVKVQTIGIQELVKQVEGFKTAKLKNQ